MLDDLNELKTFRAILAEGNLSAAARRLGVTLAVVSKRLSTLENRAGVRLVHRSTRSLSATEEGARLLTDVVHALEAIDASEGRVDHTAEFDERAVAGALDDAPVMHSNDWVDEIAAQRPQPSQCAILIRGGEATVANNVGREDRCKFPGFGHCVALRHHAA